MLTTSKKTRPWYGLVHLALYQTTWVIALWGASVGLTWPAVVTAAGTLALHLSLSSHLKLRILRLFAATCFGVVLDSVLIASGVITFPTTTLLATFLPPLWMIVLWPTFAALFDDIMRWLLPHMTWAMLAGAVAGPLAYVGGQSFGALELPLNWWVSFLSIGAAWSVAMALLLLLWRYPGAQS
jgi:Protein of unknown function (DUF2878)